MNISELKEMVVSIVENAAKLKNKHTSEHNAPVNYACIFCQSETEYKELIQLTKEFGEVIKDTPTGPLFKIPPLPTVSGNLQLLKIRIPDDKHPDLGDADFTVSDYVAFKKQHLNKEGFDILVRPDIEMLELMDPAFNVRAYFSNPPLDKTLGLV